MSKATGKIDVFVVSLARTPERRQRVLDELEACGIACTVYEAVDATRVSMDWLNDNVDSHAVQEKWGRPLSGPEIACALSHKGIYASIVELGLDGAIVLEDDAIIEPGFVTVNDFFRSSASSWRDKRAMFHLELLSRPYGEGAVLNSRAAIRVDSSHSFKPLVASLSTEPWGSCGYYVTNAAAKSLLTTGKVSSVADDWSGWAKRSRGKIYVSVPQSVSHPIDSTETTIQDTVNRASELTALERDKRLRGTDWVLRIAYKAWMKLVFKPIALWYLRG